MNTFESNKQAVEKVLFFFQDYFSIDIMSKVEQIQKGTLSFSGTLRELEMHRDLAELIDAYIHGEMELARVIAHSQLLKLVKDLSFSIKDAEGAKRAAMLFTSISSCLEGYEEFYEEDRQLLLKSFQNDQLFKSSDFEDDSFKELDRSYLKRIQKQFSEQKKTFRTYVYKGAQQLPSDSAFSIKDHVLITDSLEGILLSLKPVKDDTIKVALFLKLEPVVDFSYFILSVQYKDSIWLSSDFIEFSNPSMQERRRNPRRLSEGRENNNTLPYGLIDDVIKWRNESTFVTKEAGQEVYTYNMFDFPTYTRIMLSYTIKYVLKEIFEKQLDFESIYNARTAIDLYDESEDDLKHFEGSNIKALEDLLADYAFEDETPKSTELAVVSKELSLIYEKHNRLVTKEQLQTEASWVKHKTIADKMFSRQEPTSSEVEDLKTLFKDNIERVYSYVFSGKYVYVLDVDNILSRSSFGFNPSKQVALFTLVKDGADPFYLHLFNLSPEDSKKTLYRHNFEPYCFMCNTYKTKGISGITINFPSHKVMTLLTGASRTDLPMYYRNYYSSSAFPYIGNHILDNVRPEFVAMEYDPCSKRHPNGFKLSLELCGICKRRLYAKYKKFESSVILFSSKKGSLVDIIDHNLLQDYFLENYNIKLNKSEYGVFSIE